MAANNFPDIQFYYSNKLNKLTYKGVLAPFMAQ